MKLEAIAKGGYGGGQILEPRSNEELLEMHEQGSVGGRHMVAHTKAHMHYNVLLWIMGLSLLCE